MDTPQQTNMDNNSFIATNEKNETGTISPLVSFITYRVFLIINSFSLTNFIAVFGVFSNSLNIVVYLKLGLRESTNINFLALGIVDWLVCVCSCLVVVSHLNEISPYGDSIKYLDIHVSSFILFPCMGMGAWIIVLLSAERCLCIVVPLKVKTIITRRRIICLISGMAVYETVFGFFMMTFVDSPESTNRIRQLLIFSCMSVPVFVCFILVLFFTIFMVIRLRQTLEWRTTTATQSTKTSGAKERKVVLSVLWICIMFIVCFTPFVIYFVTAIVLPRFTLWDPYYGWFVQTTWTFNFLFQTISSASNIFVYFFVSTKFRKVLKSVLMCQN